MIIERAFEAVRIYHALSTECCHFDETIPCSHGLHLNETDDILLGERGQLAHDCQRHDHLLVLELKHRTQGFVLLPGDPIKPHNAQAGLALTVE